MNTYDNKYGILKVAKELYDKFIEPYMDGFKICNNYLSKKKSIFGSTNNPLFKSVSLDFKNLVGKKILKNTGPHANLILTYYTYLGDISLGGGRGLNQIIDEDNNIHLDRLKEILVLASNKDKSPLNENGRPSNGISLEGGKRNNTMRRRKLLPKYKY